LREKRRASPHSKLIGIHIVIGTATAFAAFTHTLFAMMSLGSSSAIGGGNAALLAGVGAMLVLMAHIGIGLRLREPKLRRRPEVRRRHMAAAITISALAIGHISMLWISG
jgi:hypothetical protein